MIKKIVLFLLIAIVLFWLIIIVTGLHFYSVDIPVKIPWVIILLTGIFLFLSSKLKSQRLAVGIVFPIVLLLYIPIVWWIGYGLIIGIESDIESVECRQCNKTVIRYFHQKPWGGTPLETTGIGETYLGGLVYKTEIDTTYFAEWQYAEEVSNEYELPKHINSKDLIFVWKGQKIVLIYRKNEETQCYPLINNKL